MADQKKNPQVNPSTTRQTPNPNETPEQKREREQRESEQQGETLNPDNKKDGETSDQP